MPIIKVTDIKEEYRHLSANPHHCPSGETGTWKPVERGLTFDFIEDFTVRCEKCGATETFQFDVSAAYPPEEVESIRQAGKVMAQMGMKYFTHKKY